MFAWILNTNPENRGVTAATRPFELGKSPGAGAMVRNLSRKGSTPKLLMALPKKTGGDLTPQEPSLIEATPGAVKESQLVQQMAMHVVTDHLQKLGGT